jgi:hypothetical protein
MTNEIKRVCITDEQSVPYNATNSTEVIESMKEQILEKVEKSYNYGIWGHPDINCPLGELAFTYDNPQIIDGKLYVDLKILDTTKGKAMKDLIDYRGTTSGYGRKKDKSIEDYTLASVYVVERDDPSTSTNTH